MARRKQTIGRKGYMRPVTHQPPPPREYERTEVDNTEAPVIRRNLHRNERKWRRERYLKMRLQQKLTSLYNICKTSEKLADDVLE